MVPEGGCAPRGFTTSFERALLAFRSNLFLHLPIIALLHNRGLGEVVPNLGGRLLFVFFLFSPRPNSSVPLDSSRASSVLTTFSAL
jgi:hypothetical protein